MGAPPALAPDSARAQAFVQRALKSPTFLVTGGGEGGVQRVAYAIANRPKPTEVVYAERAIPTDREVPVERGSPFSDLEFATYLGTSTSSAHLATTDVDPSQLPLSGNVARDTIPFGDTVLTLVAEPRGLLGSSFGAELPWIFLVGGVVLSVATALVAAELARRRQTAESDAGTIAVRYGQLDGLYPGPSPRPSSTPSCRPRPPRSRTSRSPSAAWPERPGSMSVATGTAQCRWTNATWRWWSATSPVGG